MGCLGLSRNILDLFGVESVAALFKKSSHLLVKSSGKMAFVSASQTNLSGTSKISTAEEGSIIYYGL